MNSKRIKTLVTRMLLVVTLLLGTVALTGTTAHAQRSRGWDRNRGQVHVHPGWSYRRWPRYNRWYWSGYPFGYQSYYYFPSTHVTEGQGYRDGRDDGKDDAKDGKGYDPYRHKDYQNAETSAYISGYIRGYQEGYRQVSG